MAIKNIAGNTYGRLTVNEYSHKHEVQRASYWKCTCACGNNVVVRQSSLSGGTSKSCGCLQKELASKIILKEIKRRTKPYGVAAQNNIFAGYKKDAKRRKYVFKISKSDFLNLTKKNCYYCNAAPSQVRKNKRWNGSYTYNGIDRKNNDIGYITSNVVSCCKKCNVAKMAMSEDDFMKLIKNIYEFRKLGSYR